MQPLLINYRTLCCVVFLTSLAAASSVYEKKCNDSRECAVYPNMTQGPDTNWIPFFCNENNLCVCPNGWVPELNRSICIARISGSLTSDTCAAYVWTISLLIFTLLTLITYSFVSLFSRRTTVVPKYNNLTESMKNYRNFTITDESLEKF
ncbi:uncharacterized protein LOC124412422 [Diprion similis]|uniref:uncharacterized protein LOC124412422 n=1 Tax=Diprion similis TaxID=362088 RepID=UPI001EF86B74|nr:uncharacterized protein LOC124412422 [Diprion similis]